MEKLFLFMFCALSFLNLSAQNHADTLKIGVYNSPPFVILKNNELNGGVSVWLWNQIKEEIDHPFKIITYTSNQPLQDILMDLNKGTIDFSINPLTITHDRSDQLDFTYPFYVGNLTIAKKRQSNIDSVTTVLNAIFNQRLLYLVLVLALMVMLFGLIIWFVERKNHHFEQGIQGLFSSFWWSAVTMTTVGYGDKVPISNLGRFIAFLWMLCSLVIISIFTASITSNLTVHKLANSNLSIDDFKQSEVGTVSASASESFLDRNFFRNIKHYSNLNEGLQRLQDDSVELFIYDEPWLAYQLKNNPKFEDLSLMDLRFEVQLYAFPMKKSLDPNLKNYLNTSILSRTESQDWHLLLNEYQLIKN